MWLDHGSPKPSRPPAAASVWPSSRSSTTTGRRHACSHLERWRRRREGRAEDRGTRLDVGIFASRPDGVRASWGSGETTRMEARRPPRGRASIWASRSAVGIRHRNRIRSLVRLRPEPLLSLLRAPASATRPKPGRADGQRIVRPRVYHLPRNAVVRDPRALARHLAGGLRAPRTRARRRLRRSPARGRRRTTVFARRPIGDHAIPTKPEPLAHPLPQSAKPSQRD